MSQTWKITFGLRRSGFTATESYYTASTTPNTASAATARLLLARANMLYTGVEFVGLRVALVADTLVTGAIRRKSQFYPPGSFNVFVKPDAQGAGGVLMSIPPVGKLQGVASTPGPGRVVVRCKVSFGNSQSTHYLAFPPANVIEGEPGSYTPAANQPFKTAFGNFRNFLVADGWQVRGRLTTGVNAPQVITSWAVAPLPSRNLQLTCAGLTLGAVAQGSTVSIQATRTRPKLPFSLNGSYRVASASFASLGGITTVELANTTNPFVAGLPVDPATIKKFGTVQLVAYGLQPITDFEGISAGTHKRGNSFGGERGSRKTRTSLDP